MQTLPNTLDQLFEELRPQIFRHALRLTGNTEDAEDVTQGTLLKAFLKRDSYRGETAPLGWMYRIARNEAYDLFRHRKRRPAASLEALQPEVGAGVFEMPDQTPGPEASLIVSEQRKRVRDAVGSMAEAEREPLLLVDLDEVPYREAADLIGLSVPGFKTRRFRARRSLALALRDLDPSGRDAA